MTEFTDLEATEILKLSSMIISLVRPLIHQQTIPIISWSLADHSDNQLIRPYISCSVEWSTCIGPSEADDLKRGQLKRSAWFQALSNMGWNLFANKNFSFGFVKISLDCKSKHCHSIQTFGLLDATVIDLPYLYTYITTSVVYTLLYTFRYIHIHVYIFHRTNTNHNMYMFTSGHTLIILCLHHILDKHIWLLIYLVKIFACTCLQSYTITNAWWWWLPFVHL